MKTIALVTDYSDWVLTDDAQKGGVGVVARNLYSTLIEQGYKIKIFAYKGENKTFDNTEIKIINYLPESDEFIEQLDILTKDCDKVFTFHFYNVYEGLLLQSHSSIHRAASNIFLKPFKKIIYSKRIKEQQDVYKKTSKYKNIYAVSNILKKDYEKNFGIKNIKVSYPGCKKIYDEFPLNLSKTLTFGIVANNSINKGGHYFIIALAIARLFSLDCKVKIIAPKFKKDIFMKFLFFVFGLNKIAEVLPRQNDMSYFYENIDCLVMPSQNEAFGLVALEALSYGKTCLVSNTVGFAEILKGNDGFIFNRKSFYDFVKSLVNIGKIYYSDRENFNYICKNGWELSKKYNWENFVNGLLT